MEEIEGIYKDGKISLLQQPDHKKAKVKIQFIEDIDNNDSEKTFPTKKLGKIKNISRKDIYGEFLSDRY